MSVYSLLTSGVKGDESLMKYLQPLKHNVSYLYEDPMLFKFSLRVHRALSLLICIGCGTAQLAGNALTHAQEQHKIPHNAQQKAAFDARCQALGVATTLPNIRKFPPGNAAVEGITVQTGYACSLCDYCALTTKTITKHCHAREVHDPKATFKRDAKLQTLFHPVGTGYFEVDVRTSDALNEQVLSAVRQQVLPRLQLKDPLGDGRTPTSFREVPPLLIITRWHERMSAFVDDERLRRQLIDIRDGVKGVTEPGFDRLYNEVLMMMKTAELFARDLTIEARCAVMQGRESH